MQLGASALLPATLERRAHRPPMCLPPLGHQWRLGKVRLISISSMATTVGSPPGATATATSRIPTLSERSTVAAPGAICLPRTWRPPSSPVHRCGSSTAGWSRCASPVRPEAGTCRPVSCGVPTMAARDGRRLTLVVSSPPWHRLEIECGHWWIPVVDFPVLHFTCSTDQTPTQPGGVPLRPCRLDRAKVPDLVWMRLITPPTSPHRATPTAPPPQD